VIRLVETPTRFSIVDAKPCEVEKLATYSHFAIIEFTSLRVIFNLVQKGLCEFKVSFACKFISEPSAADT
jgi:hypothetical protein